VFLYLHDHNDSSYHSVSLLLESKIVDTSKRLKKDRRTAVRADFSSYRIANVWNSLPELVMTARSVNSFKGRRRFEFMELFARTSGDNMQAQWTASRDVLTSFVLDTCRRWGIHTQTSDYVTYPGFRSVNIRLDKMMKMMVTMSFDVSVHSVTSLTLELLSAN